MSLKNIAIFMAPMLLLLYFSAIQNDYIVFAIPNTLANDTLTPLPPTNQPPISNQTIPGNATSIAACPSNQTKGISSDEYVFVTKWGCRGQGDGQFDALSDVETDSLGNVYVVDVLNNRIQKFDSNGDFITKWGSYGTGDGQFAGPNGVATDSSDYVYVSNSDSMSEIDTMEIQKFDSNGNFITKWGSKGTGDGQFYLPFGIAVDSLDNVYVAEYGNNRIQKFDSNGNFTTKWGSTGNGDGQFNGPRGIAVDSSNNVYVTEPNNGRVQKFDSNGNFITKWGSPGTGNGQFCQPTDIAVDSSSNVYVADCNRIQKFDSSGKFITKWGSPGSGNGQFNYVYGIALDASGNVYVADQGNNRIQVFAPSS